MVPGQRLVVAEQAPQAPADSVYCGVLKPGRMALEPYEATH